MSTPSRRLNSSLSGSTLLVLSLAILCCGFAPPQAAPAVWFISPGANGDGSSRDAPLGSAAEVERLTGPGDTLFLRSSGPALPGGLALKTSQVLIGLQDGDGRTPVITNRDSTRHGGCGLVLADGVHVRNVRIEDTDASGVYGLDVSARLDSLTVARANVAHRRLDLGRSLEPLFAPVHGGIVVAFTRDSAAVEVTHARVTDAAGVGVQSVTTGSAQSRLVVRDSRVTGGTAIGFYDAGIVGLLRDSTARAYVELIDVDARGRLSEVGRNFVVEAAGGARARVYAERFTSGPCGQDGLLFTMLQSPATLDARLVDCDISQAGQMNLEGTMLNYPPDGAQPADGGRISIDVEGSILRDGGTMASFAEAYQNIWLGSSGGVDTLPPVVGTYELTVRDSRITGAGRVGIELGEPPVGGVAVPDESTYRVLLRDNVIAGNGAADVAVFVRDAEVDARGNCWREGGSLTAKQFVTQAPASDRQVDVSSPADCP